MKKGYMFVDLLAAIVLIGATAAAVGVVFGSAVTDLPRTCKAIDAHTATAVVLAQLRKDVERARALSVTADKGRAQTLVIDLPDGRVSYSMEGEKVARTVAGADGRTDEKQANSWSLPAVEVRWRLWRPEGKAVGLEVRTAVRVKSDGRETLKLKNSHVLFAGAGAEGGLP